ncbi:Mu transposase C-terminal domain-containing protein [Streptomyces achromogenes]|uniref:Mu transposase C-terminal domain-containing protein n=1 Tax=Streptomyces achromogenes TaxID=67255 RepID=UPI003A813486
MSGRQVTLTDSSGVARHMDVVEVLRGVGVMVVGGAKNSGPAQCLPPDDALARARWWQVHVVEVLTGLPPQARPGARPRPAFDPGRRCLAEREAAKARELAGMGVGGVSARTVRRKRQRYQAQGLSGLVDGRAGRREAPGARLDPRVVDVVREVVLSAPSGETVSPGLLRTVIADRLAGPIAAGEVRVPSRSALRRLYTDLTTGGTGARAPAAVVGERVHLSLVTLPGLPGGPVACPRPRVLFALDEASGVLLTAVARDARDHTVHGPPLLARMCVPADQRCSWAGRLLPALLAQPDRAPVGLRADGAAVIRPGTLVVDRAAVPGMAGLRTACARKGVHVQDTRTAKPYDRGRVERILAHAAALFAAHLLTPAGRRAEATGWAPEAVQEVLDSWIERVWPHRPLPPGVADPGQTPYTRYRQLTASAGWTATPLPPAEFLALLNSTRRVLGPHGLRLGGRVYDAPVLEPLRRAAAHGASSIYEVRWDPYDPLRVWLRAADDEWLVVPAA